jgi:hypothetical protein
MPVRAERQRGHCTVVVPKGASDLPACLDIPQPQDVVTVSRSNSAPVAAENSPVEDLSQSWLFFQRGQ